VTVAHWDMGIRAKSTVQNTWSNIPQSYGDYCQSVEAQVQESIFRYHTTTKLIWRLFLKDCVKAVCVPQLSYDCEIIRDMANSSGLQLIMFESSYSELSVFKPNNVSSLERLTERYKKAVKGIFTGNQLKRAKITIQQRLSGIYTSPTMGYMKGSKLKNKQLNAPDGTCILFLHCFTDAPNGMIETPEQRLFNDYLEHAFYVIQRTAELGIPLLIKPHPSNHRYPADKPLFRALHVKVEMLSKNSNWFVRWIDDGTSNDSFTKLRKPFAITGGGTVMMECGFLGIPVCISSAQQWEDLHFVRRARSIMELDHFLLNPYKGYDENKAKEDAIRLQAYLEKQKWEHRPDCINLYDTRNGTLGYNDMQELVDRRLEI
jgi:hypothetical protein